MINMGTSSQNHHLPHKADKDGPACQQAKETGTVTMPMQQMGKEVVHLPCSHGWSLAGAFAHSNEATTMKRLCLT